MAKEKEKTSPHPPAATPGETLEILGAMAKENPSPSLMAYSFHPESADELYDVMAAATNGEAERASAHQGEPIELENWFAHMIELTEDRTKEPKWCCRTVFFAKNGKQYAAVSTGVLASLILMVRCFGESTLDPPKKIAFNEISTGGKNRYLQFGPVK